jgi:hypothetical protein
MYFSRLSCFERSWARQRERCVAWENAGGGTLARSLVVAAFLAILTLAWADIRARVGVMEECREER